MKFDTRTVLTNYADNQPFTSDEPVFGEYFKDEKGNEVLDEKGRPVPKTRPVPVTVRWVFAKALDNLSVSTPMGVEDKRKLGRLAEKMWKMPNCILKEADVEAITKTVGACMAASILIALENFFAEASETDVDASEEKIAEQQLENL